MRLEIPRQEIDTAMFFVKSLLHCSRHCFSRYFRRRWTRSLSNYMANFSNSFTEVTKFFKFSSAHPVTRLYAAINNKHKFRQGDASANDWFVKQ